MTMSRLLRLSKILSVAARYRLDEFLSPQHFNGIPRVLIRLYSLPWLADDCRCLPKAQRLKLALQELGPIFIKLGQLLSTRRDFLDLEVADALQDLQDKVPPFTYPSIATLVEKELGIPPSQVFSFLATQLLAVDAFAVDRELVDAQVRVDVDAV
jgi:ubiquinone biosynthesis protein